ncbi:MAG TPA: hypothetical protein PKG48_02220 [Bacteroidales bacterium]|nr:hypothetical protein [Bacteroidales bacterium]HPS61986.1 hypothetical protein [Bacteroidales bacterium]
MNQVAEAINDIRFRIRAESVVNDLLSKGYSYDDFVVRFKSAHKRHWENDILHCEFKGGKFHLDLSRDGIFDALPEYLFLKPVDDHSIKPAEREKILEFNKQQRTFANILLSPIEHAIFEKRVDLESFENDVLALLSGSSLQSLIDFYRIDDPALSPVDRVKLARAIPLLHSVVGDFPVTAKILSYLLDEPVQYEMAEGFKPIGNPEKASPGGLGASACGDTLIIGGSVEEPVPVIRLRIGPVHADQVATYLTGGEKETLLRHFRNYFLPLEYDLELVVDVSVTEASFTLDNSFLGFNSATN